MSFYVTLITIAMMFAYSVPGFWLTKSKKVPASGISYFATTLVCVCAPCQVFDALHRVTKSAYNTEHIIWMFVLNFIMMGGMMALCYFVLRKKQESVRVRILTLAPSLGNCGFIGVPLLEALFPNYPQIVGFAAGAFVVSNIMMWSFASAIITHNPKYVRLDKIFLNPCTVASFIGLIFYAMDWRVTGTPLTIIQTFSKMSTPLCMLILGMRLGIVPFKPIFMDLGQYLAVAGKLIVFPVLALLLAKCLPWLERDFVRGFCVLCVVPTGNNVLSFAEMLGEGQDTAANVVLLSTMLCIITIPTILRFV